MSSAPVDVYASISNVRCALPIFTETDPGQADVHPCGELVFLNLGTTQFITSEGGGPGGVESLKIECLMGHVLFVRDPDCDVDVTFEQAFGAISDFVDVITNLEDDNDE